MKGQPIATRVVRTNGTHDQHSHQPISAPYGLAVTFDTLSELGGCP